MAKPGATPDGAPADGGTRGAYALGAKLGALGLGADAIAAALLAEAARRGWSAVKFEDAHFIGAQIGESEPEQLPHLLRSVGALETPGAPGGAPAVIDAGDLLARKFQPVRWLAQGLVAEGLFLLAGRPKTGKSWLALQLAHAVAGGGDFLGRRTTRAGALVLALEDNERRLQRRLEALGAQPGMAGLKLATAWPRADRGGLEQLSAWLAENRDCRLVIIDTLGRFRRPTDRGANAYDSDYAALAAMKAVADARGVTMLAVHHVRKMAADDPLDRISGTAAIAGAADGILILTRARGEAGAILTATGRDLEEVADLGLEFDTPTGRWLAAGSGAELRVSRERRAILDALRREGPLSAAEAADSAKLPRASVRHLLRVMFADGLVLQDSDRRYRCPAAGP